MRQISMACLALFVFGLSVMAAEPAEKKMTAESYYSRAYLEMTRSEYKQAIKDLDTVISMSPRSSQAYCMRGMAKDRLADKEGNTECSSAMADFAMSIKLDPKNAEPYFYRGLRLSRIGNYKAALADYNKAIELFPDDAGTYYNRAIVYKKLRRYTEAKQDYNAALKLGFKGEDLFGDSGAEIGKFFLICVGIFALIMALVIFIIVKRGSLSDQIMPMDAEDYKGEN